MVGWNSRGPGGALPPEVHASAGEAVQGDKTESGNARQRVIEISAFQFSVFHVSINLHESIGGSLRIEVFAIFLMAPFAKGNRPFVR